MHISLSEVQRIAQLAQLDPAEDQLEKMGEQLNNILSMVEQIRAVDTSQVEPLSHPLALYQENTALRLREDAVTETDQRSTYQQQAPAVEKGLYLVPKVIE